jgi:2-methylaconitate cis-trans-isomerase PrpF
MIAHIANADGSPCPTLVLDATQLPRGEDELCAALAAARKALIAADEPHVLKIALISPARHPLFDLDYRFVQCLPGAPDRFDLRGSCGHSILSSIMVASQLGWLPRLAPDTRVRVHVINNGDHVVCEVDEAGRRDGNFTMHFLPTAVARLDDLLLDRAPVTELSSAGVRYPVSLVSVGNPYVFVDAASLGISTHAELFADDPELFERLAALRLAAARRLGLPGEGAFPKIAAVGQFEPGRLAVRAISVPSWHPTLAATGAVCLGAASTIAGTIPYELARRAGCTPGDVAIDTPGGSTAVSAEVSGTAGDDRLLWTSLTRKRAHLVRAVVLDALRDLLPLPEESDPCLALSH